MTPAISTSHPPSYKLSEQLVGHETDVRAVLFPSAEMVVSASRDRTVRVWQRPTGASGQFAGRVARKASAWVGALAYLPPDAQQPGGLIASGDKDGLLEVVAPTANPTDNAERLLVGHAGSVCTLDVSPAGNWIVSGSWDCQARVWNVGRWVTELELVHGDLGVWAVLALDKNTVVTGSADKKIRIFDLPPSRTPGADPVRPRCVIHTPEVVRALCRVPSGHTSGADIASASNDQVIRLWKLDGRQMGELHGHESFIYSLAALPTGEIASSGEDRSLRIWRGFECVQTITHPALSVWSVAVCAETGDLVTGASDGVARIFTRSADRVAEAEMLNLFHESVKASAIPRQQISDVVNKDTLPGPDFLQNKSGRRDGQTQMIREADGSVTAHQWSMSQQQWIMVGTVVESVGSSGRKVDYQGKSYDYVFDVDIEDGKPPLKLPFNLSENPYDRAGLFLEENNLPTSYLETVIRFIVENTQGQTIQSAPNSAPAAAPGLHVDDLTLDGHSVLPHRDYLPILGAKFDAIIKKILGTNETMISAGRKDFALNPSDQSALRALPAELEAGRQASDAALQLVLRVVTLWPYGDRLAGLDLLRCMVAHPAVAGYRHPTYGSTLAIACASAAGTGDAPGAASASPAARQNCTMMAVRLLANLCTSAPGRGIVAADDAAMRLLDDAVDTAATSRNLALAAATALLNLAVLARAQPAVLPPAAPARLRALLGCLLTAALTDADVLYRALVALGSLPLEGADADQRREARAWVQAAMAACDEARVQEIGVRCLAIL